MHNGFVMARFSENLDMRIKNNQQKNCKHIQKARSHEHGPKPVILGGCSADQAANRDRNRQSSDTEQASLKTLIIFINMMGENRVIRGH